MILVASFMILDNAKDSFLASCLVIGRERGKIIINFRLEHKFTCILAVPCYRQAMSYRCEKITNEYQGFTVKSLDRAETSSRLFLTLGLRSPRILLSNVSQNSSNKTTLRHFSGSLQDFKHNWN